MGTRRVKLKPEQKKRFFVGIDGTLALDTVVWGHLWNAHFGWSNLLWELDKDPADGQRHVDSAHSKLPIARLIRSHRGVTFADTCVLPQGIDAKGTDKLWAGSNASANKADMDSNAQFMQTFLLSPSAEKTTSSLNDVGQGVTADIVYISSHGGSFGTMSGELSFVDHLFNLGKTAQSGGLFNGPGWVLLSNCSTLADTTHADWLALMSGPTPLRGVLGFQQLCPLAPGSADIFSSFIRGNTPVKGLARGHTFIEAWSTALRHHGLKDAWVVLCHENAVGDNIADWNEDKLTVLPANSKILMFDENNLTGKQVIPPSDPFTAFWSKGATQITIGNRTDPANKLRVGDRVSMTIKPPAGQATFNTGDDIAVTLIYIRPDFQKGPIDVNKMFKILGQVGIDPPTTADLNPQSPGADDSWQMKVKGTPAEIKLDLECKDLSMLPHSNYPLRMRVKIPVQQHDFNRNGSIYIEK